MTTEAVTTIDHETIRRWVEERGGRPAAVLASSDDGESGVLRIEFEDQEDGLEEISWDEFFAEFEERKLAFTFQAEAASGSSGRFCKLVRRTNSVH